MTNKTKTKKELKRFVTFPMFIAQLIGGRPSDYKIESVTYPSGDTFKEERGARAGGVE